LFLQKSHLWGVRRCYVVFLENIRNWQRRKQWVAILSRRGFYEPRNPKIAVSINHETVQGQIRTLGGYKRYMGGRKRKIPILFIESNPTSFNLTDLQITIAFKMMVQLVPAAIFNILSLSPQILHCTILVCNCELWLFKIKVTSSTSTLNIFLRQIIEFRKLISLKYTSITNYLGCDSPKYMNFKTSIRNRLSMCLFIYIHDNYLFYISNTTYSLQQRSTHRIGK
jgi:hypothetical protein